MLFLSVARGVEGEGVEGSGAASRVTYLGSGCVKCACVCVCVCVRVRLYMSFDSDLGLC